MSTWASTHTPEGRHSWNVLHRAWTACVGLPKYQKSAWGNLDDLHGEIPHDKFIAAIERLVDIQGGREAYLAILERDPLPSHEENLKKCQEEMP
jgi:hypothetical protein